MPLPDGPDATAADDTDAPAPYTVSVRALCEFAAKSGDLDLRFTPSPTAQEGIAGHRSVAASRSTGYQREVTLSLAHGGLLVRGRADGYDRSRGLIEEIKTFRGDLARVTANRRVFHRAQAEVYGWMLCVRDDLDAIDVALVYYDVDLDIEMPALVERRTAVQLRTRFEALCERFVTWADDECAHRIARDAWLDELRFPHAMFRPGQRELARAVWRSVRDARGLAAEAPTGIGKTIGTLFPAMKAMAPESVDRVFFLTARGTGRALALDAADTIRRSNPGAAFRILDLTARDKACEYPDRACHGDSCPLAKGFYDRLPAARIAAREVAVLTRDALRATALDHQVCPYYLGLEMARWCDLVVADYNHWFDGYPLLFALAEEHRWRTVLLVDEAHNLLDRARSMYSARLDTQAIAALSDASQATLKKPIARLVRDWNAIVSGVPGDHQVCETLPRPWLSALDDLTRAIAARLADEPMAALGPMARFHFDALHLLRLAESMGDHSIFDVTVERGARSALRSSIGVRNLVPAPHLAPRFAAARATILFSATLTPHAFYADLLGLPADTVRIDVAAPFATDQLTVRIVRDISTRFHDRARSLRPMARLIAAQYATTPGNYLVFVSSHDYLERLATTFVSGHPHIAVWSQARRMSDDHRRAFLARFASGGQGIGFAVLGGVFAEGIDLPGDRLIGAFVATLGLPQFDGINEEQRRRHDTRFGAGYDYTYLFPGIRRVVQAAGRVIRSTSDRGTLHLIDDRFARPEVLALLPRWWTVAACSTERSTGADDVADDRADRDANAHVGVEYG